MLKLPYISLIILWIIFGIIHSGLASGIVTRTIEKIMGKAAKYYRAIYSLLVFITFLVLVHYHFAAIDTILFRPHWIEKIIAGILILAGFVVMVIYIWKNLVNFSGLGIVFGIEENTELQQTGLYAYSRHPMFAAAIIFMWGVFLGYPYMNNLISSICLTVYALIAIYFVEKRLVAAYGHAYKQYQKNTPLLMPTKFRIRSDR
ncbi:MAG: isoprenylcysteine carboxylmethyltransferase family protein [Sediminibacterium sp.]|nr:isoprenylcysteine carboxylmethyltransferase family protein [Sediminibacterium sp.]